MDTLSIFRKDECEIFPVISPAANDLRSINFYVVKYYESLILIDAGINNKTNWNALCSTLAQNDLQVTDLTAIILTHHHYDHIGLVDKIVSKNPIPVFASSEAIPRLKRDRDFLEKRIQFYNSLYRQMGCGEMGIARVRDLKQAIEQNKHQAIQADIHIITNTRLFHFDVIDVPGHAPDHIALWDNKTKWMFSGDLLIEHISSNALVEPDIDGNRIHTLAQQKESLLKCSTLNPEFLFPGHGKIIQNAKQLVKNRIDRYEEKFDRLLRFIKAGNTTANDLALAYYKKTYFNQFSLVMSEVISHLDYLEEKQRIIKEFRNGIWHYEIAY
ncbi:MBL fold metallo-hydrolase [Bacillus sp. B15-48]|uniref:MBL fold metallo-hydrolase n=1 Tax=Bacillus sp. B15-48 TaxID=1548601 RepID=UPI0031B833C1